MSFLRASSSSVHNMLNVEINYKKCHATDLQNDFCKNLFLKMKSAAGPLSFITSQRIELETGVWNQIVENPLTSSQVMLCTSNITNWNLGSHHIFRDCLLSVTTSWPHIFKKNLLKAICCAWAIKHFEMQESHHSQFHSISLITARRIELDQIVEQKSFQTSSIFKRLLH